MRVFLKPIIPITTAIIVISACSTPEKKAKDYMTNRDNVALKEVIGSGNLTYTQSKLDSTAYRDLFNKIKTAQDS